MNGKRTLIVDVDGTVLMPLKRKVAAFLEAISSVGKRMEGDLVKKARETYDFGAMKRHFSTSKDLDSAIFDNFLNNNFLIREGQILDEPVPGAVEFLTKALKSGCDIVYLTGRHSGRVESGVPSGGMVEGTIQTLQHHGFPMPNGKDVSIIFKPNKNMEDIEYKVSKIDGIAKKSDIAAIFDDRPKFIKEATIRYPRSNRIGMMTYGDDKMESYGCVDEKQLHITEFLGEKVKLVPNKCVRDFTEVDVRDGCKIGFKRRVDK